MCDPVSIGLAVAGTAASLYGGMQSASAQRSAANAVATQNRQMQLAQNEGFTQRLQAGLRQTGAQTAASEETLASRSGAADQMRQAQMAAMKNYQDAIDAQNAQAESLRQTGDTAAQTLLKATTGDQLAGAQTQRQAQQEALAAAQTPTGPETSNPTPGGDQVQQGALKRRMAEAATNIRTYGSRIAASDAYAAPAQQVRLAAGDTAYGIMPAQQAERLLGSGSAVRLMPGKTAYGSATGLGQAQDLLLQSRGQSALEGAGLSYGNAVDLANLQQSNEQTTAKNIADQAQADAAYKASQGQMISSLGKLALYGAGYFGGPTAAAPGWAAGTGAGSGVFTNLATGATTDIPGITMPSVSRFSPISSLFGSIR